MNDTIGILGAGAWGTGLAQIFAIHGRSVKIWTRRDTTVENINIARDNHALPDVVLHPGIRAVREHSDLDDCDVLIYALPAQALRQHLIDAPPKAHQTLVIAAKGIELNTGKLLIDVVHDVCPDMGVAVLSGPNIALEIARGQPAASTIACRDEIRLKELQTLLSTRSFRVYPTTDVIGVSVGGAVKNVIIMGSGIVDGMGLGENARAAILTRGLAEMTRLSVALGGQRETLMGLSGVGDLMLKTRNYRFGLALADGLTHDLHSDSTVEGIHTASAVVTLAGMKNVEMPICVAVAACLNGQMTLPQAVDVLMQRPQRQTEAE
jgi:glycerol-3-phosphate dehydrogenase (NAD(P)+)